MKDYHINIFYSEDDEGYIADIPDLEYCSAFGETPQEALGELEIAKAAWLTVALLAPGNDYEVWSPFDTAGAAEKLMEMLEEDRHPAISDGVRFPCNIVGT